MLTRSCAQFYQDIKQYDLVSSNRCRSFCEREYQQQIATQIISILSSHASLTVVELSKTLSKNIVSVRNVLSFLLKEKIVSRRKKGLGGAISYYYKLEKKTATLPSDSAIIALHIDVEKLLPYNGCRFNTRLANSVGLKMYPNFLKHYGILKRTDFGLVIDIKPDWRARVNQQLKRKYSKRSVSLQHILLIYDRLLTCYSPGEVVPATEAEKITNTSIYFLRKWGLFRVQSLHSRKKLYYLVTKETLLRSVNELGNQCIS